MIEITAGDRLNSALYPLKELAQQKIQESSWIIKLCSINSNHVVLDYGAGFGFIAREIKKVAKQVYTFNIDDDFTEYCVSLGLDIYNNQPVDITIMKDVVENFSYAQFDKILKTLDTKKLLFNFYDIYLSQDENKCKHSHAQILQLATTHNYKILLKEKDKSICRVLMKKQ